MPFFRYWHIYYDSAFVKMPFKLPSALLLQLQIGIETHSWPSLSEIPQLPRCLLVLESFLLDQLNWSCSENNLRELEQAQMQLNTVLLGLQCEKSYGSQLWKKSKRRIQASIIHFFLFLKMTISALIPSNCENIYDAFNKKKLSTTISCLESLVNKIVTNIPPLYTFMISEFKDEQNILLDFFEELNSFILHLPTANIGEFQKIPQIMKYICAINPLEENKEGQEDNFYIRKKNVTLFQTPKQSNDFIIERQRKKNNMNNFTVVNNSIVKSKKSSDDKSIHSLKQDALVLFKFRDEIRNNSMKITLKKKVSLGSFVKQNSSKSQKQLSQSRERLISVLNNPIKSNTMILPSQIRSKKHTAIQKRHRNETMKTVDSNFSQSFQKIPQIIEMEQIENQRQQKLKKKRIAKLPIITNSYSEQQFLLTGTRKGWGIIKQYINQKIANRKLKKLLLF